MVDGEGWGWFLGELKSTVKSVSSSLVGDSVVLDVGNGESHPEVILIGVSTYCTLGVDVVDVRIYSSYCRR